MFVGGSPRVARWVAATGCLLVGLGACGGGGGGGGSGTTTQGFNTAEFQFNYGLGNINALAVYGGGFSGAGQTIAIIDTGIDVDHPDLIANIAAASTDIVSGDPTFLNDVDGHGTQVAGVAAAARNGFGGHGVAFNAQILAIRADAAAICIDTSCGFDDADLAAAVDFAVAQGADVINMSLAGAAPSSAGLQTAIQNAVAAGVIFAIAAGNQAGVDPLNPAALASDPAVNGQIIAVGAVDQNNVIADFSNRAGTAQNFFLVAPGVAILTTTIGGGFASANGTSFAAPHVAGGIALLLERFPNLTAQNAVNILLTTATDLGAVGTDATFGRGLLNLAAALAPLGTLTLSLGDASGGGGGEGGGRAQSLSLDDTGLNLGPAFGDGLARQPLLRSAIALDGFERAYRVDLTGRIGAANPAPDVAGILFDRAARRSASLDLVPAGSLALALTVMMPGADDGAGAAGPSDAGPDDPSVTLTGSPAPGLQLALSHDASPLARLGPSPRQYRRGEPRLVDLRLTGGAGRQTVGRPLSRPATKVVRVALHRPGRRYQHRNRASRVHRMAMDRAAPTARPDRPVQAGALRRAVDRVRGGTARRRHMIEAARLNRRAAQLYTTPRRTAEASSRFRRAA